MRILVTGGNGFIARNIGEQLSDTYDISRVTRSELDLMDGPKVMDYIRNGRFDVIIHAATYDAAPKHSTKDPAKVLESNLRMFFNIARAKEHFGKMIYFGSGAEFDREHWIPKMGEDYFDRHVPSDQYGFSKYVMTKYALSNDNIFNLRLFATFGRYEDYRVRVTSSICHDVALDRPIHIYNNKSYDFLFIDDLVRIVRWFIDNDPKNRIYNVCSGEVTGFKALADKVLGIAGKDLPMIIDNDCPGEEYSGDNSLLMEELGDFRFTPMDESLKILYGQIVDDVKIEYMTHVDGGRTNELQ